MREVLSKFSQNKKINAIQTRFYKKLLDTKYGQALSLFHKWKNLPERSDDELLLAANSFPAPPPRPRRPQPQARLRPPARPALRRALRKAPRHAAPHPQDQVQERPHVRALEHGGPQRPAADAVQADRRPVRDREPRADAERDDAADERPQRAAEGGGAGAAGAQLEPAVAGGAEEVGGGRRSGRR